MKTIVTLSLIAAMSLLAACNTVRGIGRDVKSAGKVVERTAD